VIGQNQQKLCAEMAEPEPEVVPYADDYADDEWGESGEGVLDDAPINDRNRSHSVHIGTKSGNRAPKMKETDHKARAKKNWGKLKANILKGKACRSFDLDVNATGFAICKCGHPKAAHSKANSLSPAALVKALKPTSKRDALESQKKPPGNEPTSYNDLDELVSKEEEGGGVTLKGESDKNGVDFRSTTPVKGGALLKRDSSKPATSPRAKPMGKFSWDAPDSPGHVNSRKTVDNNNAESTATSSSSSPATHDAVAGDSKGKDRRATPLVPFASSPTKTLKQPPKKEEEVIIENDDDDDDDAKTNSSSSSSDSSDGSDNDQQDDDEIDFAGDDDDDQDEEGKDHGDTKEETAGENDLLSFITSIGGPSSSPQKSKRSSISDVCARPYTKNTYEHFLIFCFVLFI
jgi:hypothetical protein